MSNASSYKTVTQETGDLSITKRDVILTSESGSKAYDGTALTKPDVKVTGSGFVTGEASDIKATGSVTTVEQGKVKNTIEFTQGTDFDENNYTIQKNEGELYITTSETELKIESLNNSWTYDGATHTHEAYKATYGDETVTSGAKNTDGKYVLTLANGDTITITATATGVKNVSDTAVDNNTFTYVVSNASSYKTVTPVIGDLSITARPVTITTPDATKPYDKSPLTAEGTVVGIVDGETYGFITTGTQTRVGYSKNTYELTLAAEDNEYTAKASNYVFTEIIGTLTVTGDPVIPEKTTPEADGIYQLGDWIPFNIAVQNVTDGELTDITVSDPTAQIVEGDGYTLVNGVAVIATLDSGATVNVNARHQVTETDILNGTYGNTATITVDDKKFYASAQTVQIDKPDGKLTVTKETTSTPANGSTYALGETITYQITVKNEGNVTISDIVVTDELTGNEWEIESLKPGQTSTAFTAAHEVTEADILKGEVVNEATAIGKTPEDEEPEVKPGKTTDETDKPDGRLTVTKEATSTPANGSSYTLGETITYQITVKNEGNVTISGIVVTDELTGDKWEIASLEPGETSNMYTAEHVVTEEDLLNGEAVNVATAIGKTPEDEDPEVKPGEDRKPTEDTESSMTVDKTLTNLPAKGYFTLGETAEFDITVTNTGNMTLTNVVVTDELAGAVVTPGNGYHANGAEAVIDSLEPGAVVIIKATYTVTENDLGQQLVNRVTVKGKGPADPKDPEKNHDPEGVTDEEEVPTDEAVTLSGAKTWIDEDNALQTRPEFITLRLMANGEEYTETQATEASNWTYTFTKLPMHTAQGEEIVYTLTEDAVPGYEPEYAENSYDVTNIRQNYTLTIYYWYDAVGGAVAADTVTRTFAYGDAYVFLSPVLEGCTADITRVSGIMEGDVEYNVVYTREAFELTINYVFRGGAIAAPSYTATLLFGDAFNQDSPVLAGYVASQRNISGTMAGRNLVYTVIYVPGETTVVINEYGVPLGIGNVEMNVGDCFE